MFSMNNQKIIGRVLWWDIRDEKGIIKDSVGSRYYFDISSFADKGITVYPGQLVVFQSNPLVKDCSCATGVRELARKTVSKIKDEGLRKQLKAMNENI